MARDFHSSYLRGVEILHGTNEDIFLSTDNYDNVQCLRHRTEAATAWHSSVKSPTGERRDTGILSKASTGDMLVHLSAQRIELTPKDIVHRVEDISRLH